MELLRSPEPYSPAFGEVLYAVSLDESEVGEEVGIFNSAATEKIGIKKALEAPEFILNVSDYLRSQVMIKPFPIQPCGIIDAGERVVFSCIACRDRVFAQPHTAGIVPVGTNEPMCGAEVRYLAEDEQDEISWIAGAGTVFARALFTDGGKEPVKIHLGRAEITEKQPIALIVNGGHLARLLTKQGRTWEEFNRFTVELHFNYQDIKSFEYRIRPLNSRKTRLAWWNRHGGIELCSFEATRETRRFERSQSRTEKILRTAFTTRREAVQLSEIPGTPQAWIVDHDNIRPVRVLSDKEFTVDDTETVSLEVRVEEVEKIPFQSI